MDKFHCWWKYFHLFLPLLPPCFTFIVLLWLSCNFVLTFHFDFYLIPFNHRYSLTVMFFFIPVNFDFNFTIHCVNFIILISPWLDFILSLNTNCLLNEAFDFKCKNFKQTVFSTSIETVGPISYSDNNLQKSNNLLMK